MHTPIVNYLSGSGVDAKGRTLSDIIAQDDIWLERAHDYIQWLFPLTERSQSISSAPVLSSEDIWQIHNSPATQSNMRAALRRMSMFYANYPEYLVSGNHNVLRITRILKSTRLLLGLPEAEEFYGHIIKLINSAGNNVHESHTSYWTEALATNLVIKRDAQANDTGSHARNIYLDIDGVLLANDRQPALHVKEFLAYVLEHYPDTTYWLTTHCKGDASEPLRNVGHLFDAESRELMKLIKPTNWDRDKTDGIDFTKPFLWFDDDLFPEEREILLKHGVFDNWIEVDLAKNSAQLNLFLQSFPLQVKNQ